MKKRKPQWRKPKRLRITKGRSIWVGLFRFGHCGCLFGHRRKVELHPPVRRFDSVHVDLVGPLPVSEGYRYLLTLVDRFTRWSEAIPLQDIRAETCCSAFLRVWVARFGVPSEITIDRGTQFTSSMWHEMNRMLGIKSNDTTAYHPQANGMVERYHRQLKAALMAAATDKGWMSSLPLVLLGIRSS